MFEAKLRAKIAELSKSGSTLLWLEGSTHNMIERAQLMKGNRLALQLSNGTIRMIAFERYAITKVGLQFWSQGRPGVLYRWEQVPTGQSVAQAEMPEATMDDTLDTWPPEGPEAA
jgi:hypothetical protein